MHGFSVGVSRHRSLGSVLKGARAKLGFSLDEAQELTRVPARYLQALEEGQYDVLPAEAYNIGFVRSYAEVLHLKPSRVIASYKEERSEMRVGGRNTSFGYHRMSDWQFLITPKILGVAGMVLLFGSVVSYIGLQVRQFAQPPHLVITNVPAEFTSAKDSVKLVGSSTVGSTVLINGEPILVSNDGSFAQDVRLTPGVNEITILAKNRIDKASERTVKVLYNADLAKADQSGTK